MVQNKTIEGMKGHEGVRLNGSSFLHGSKSNHEMKEHEGKGLNFHLNDSIFISAMCFIIYPLGDIPRFLPGVLLCAVPVSTFQGTGLPHRG